MSLVFYYGSGSPPAWRVWLALEHKRIPYEAVRLSFDKEENRTADFLKLNPRGKVPVIVHEGWALAESGAILEYLEEVWPEIPLLPGQSTQRAEARQKAREAELYLGEAVGRLSQLAFGSAEPDPAKLKAAREALAQELPRWEAALAGEWLAGELSIADFTAYPAARMLRRVGERKPQFAADDLIGPRLAAWMARIEALPCYPATIPPHWKN